MAHAIWSGAINFGLVSIPVKLFTAVRTSSDIHFHFLHEKDNGRINNVRRCSQCGKDVKWEEIVRGYEYEKGDYVIISDEDIKKAHPEANQSVDIVQFVDFGEINPMLFDKPYFLEPEKKGRHAYGLLREALRESGKVGIAKVVLRSREHMAALKPQGDALVLEMMHFADDLVTADEFDFPSAKEKPAANEMKAALMLIDTMAEKFDATQFHDRYKEQMMEVIEARVHNRPLPEGKGKAPAATNVVDLMEVLQRSLEQTKREKREGAGARDHGDAPAKKAAARGRGASSAHRGDEGGKDDADDEQAGPSLHRAKGERAPAAKGQRARKKAV